MFSAFCCFLFVVCALFCIACRSPALSLSFIGRRRVDPRKACHLGEISRKNSPGCFLQKFSPSKQLTLCPSGLRGWTQVPLVQTVWVQIPQVSYGSTPALPPPPKKQSVAAAGMLSPTEALSPGRAVRGLSLTVQADYFDTEGIRAPAGRAHWISSPTP